MDANMKRKLARAVAILAVALGAGELMDSLAGLRGKSAPEAHSAAAAKATDIEPVAAGAEVTAPKAALPEPAATATPRLPDAPAAPPASVAAAVAEAAPIPPAPLDAAPAAPTAPTLAEANLPADSCAARLDLGNSANAMLALTLVAPCQPNQRLVVKHAGLAISGQTTATGAFFADIPALDAAGEVEVLFPDGKTVAAALPVPELAGLRRFAVQWQADDAFQIHAFEDDTGYGGAGDVWAGAPHRPAPGLPAKGGFLTVLGDATAENPLLAEVYTYPADRAALPVVVVEAPVTEGSCGREILAETLHSDGGRVTVSDLTAAMPGCDALGDFLVLKNLVADLTIAATN